MTLLPDYKAIDVEFKVHEDEREFEGFASTFGNIDQGDDRVVQGAFKKTIAERFKAPARPKIKVLWQHFDPLGLPVDMFETDVGLFTRSRVSSHSLGDDAMALMRDGVVDAMSIGYIPVKFEHVEEGGRRIRDLKELKLLEYSPVTFPMNEAAVITGIKRMEQLAERGRGILDRNPADLKKFADDLGVGVLDLIRAISSGDALTDLKTSKEEKTAVSFQDLPLADRELEWDSAAAETRVREWAGAGDGITEDNVDQYRRAFVWFDQEEPLEFGSYKLQIADVIDGELVAVPRAVFAAAAAVQGARGGVDIPNEDFGPVRDHLGRYYEKMQEVFDDDSLVPPWEEDRESAGDDPGKQLEEVIQLAIKSVADLTQSIQALGVEAEPTDVTPKDSEPQDGETEGKSHEIEDDPIDSIARSLSDFRQHLQTRSMAQ